MNQNNNFLDSRTILAIFLSILVFLYWSHRTNKKAELYKQHQLTLQKEQQKTAGETNKGAQQNTKRSFKEAKAQKEKTFSYKSENFNFILSSKGMARGDFTLNKYTSREDKPIFMGDKKTFLETRLVGFRKPLHFEIKKINKNLYVGFHRSKGMTIKKTMAVDPKSYTIKYETLVTGNKDYFTGIRVLLNEGLKKSGATGFLSMLTESYYDNQQFYVYENGEGYLEIIHPEENMRESFQKVAVGALSSQYFTMAVLNESNIFPEFQMSTDTKSKLFSGSLKYDFLNPNAEYKLKYKAFVGPKETKLLNDFDTRLQGVIDYGFFGPISRVLLKLLQVFYDLFNNWGVAIIFMTVVIRIFVLPFNLMSYRSMKNMAKVAPLMKDLRERYKDDREKLNQEMLKIYREHKINPLGGCLPMLLQMPIFFALNRLLGSSIDIYKAPFLFWIQDLSTKDPYYVLPVLMGLTMFVQNKIMPSSQTMDPAQKKILMFLPLIFMFFMFPLPSGLNLYFFLSGVLGIAQQLVFYRDTGVVTTEPVVAKKVN